MLKKYKIIYNNNISFNKKGQLVYQQIFRLKFYLKYFKFCKSF